LSDVKAIVFDYGGVLATSQWDAFADFERRLGIEPGGLAPHFGIDHPERPGTPAWQLCEVGELAWSDFAALVVEVAARHGVTIPDAHDLDSLMPLGALWPMVHRVRRLKDEGYKLAILTNNVREFGAYWRATVPVDQFDVVVDSCEEGVRKPDPEIYRRTADRLGVDPTECVFLDDGASNCEAAAAVGMRTILVGSDVDAAITELDALLAPD
jgi:putative hydrolase of the HAD superfamily